MQKNTLLGLITGLIIGLAVGFVVANSINRSAVMQQVATQNAPPADAPLLNNAQPNAAVRDAQNAPMPQIVETLEKAEKEPDNFEAQVKAGDMYAQIQKFDKAAEFYEKANRINPGDYPTIVKTGNTYFDANDFEAAEKWYLKALEKNTDDLNVRTDLGVTFVERANPDLDRAIKEFQTVLQKDAKHEPTIYNLAIANFKKGNAEEANKNLQQLESINPQSQLAGRLKQIISK